MDPTPFPLVDLDLVQDPTDSISRDLHHLLLLLSVHLHLHSQDPGLLLLQDRSILSLVSSAPLLQDPDLLEDPALMVQEVALDPTAQEVALALTVSEADLVPMVLEDVPVPVVLVADLALLALVDSQAVQELDLKKAAVVANSVASKAANLQPGPMALQL